MSKRKVNYPLAVLTGIFNFAALSILYDVEKGLIAGIGTMIGTALVHLICGDPLSDDEPPKP